MIVKNTGKAARTIMKSEQVMEKAVKAIEEVEDVPWEKTKI